MFKANGFRNYCAAYVLSFAAIGVLSFIVPLSHWGTSPRYDWDYFNALSLFVRSSILTYHRPPIQDPWLCGGLDVLTNPQNRIFSPFGLFDIVFAPEVANLLPLVIYAALGAAGMHVALRARGQSRLAAYLGGALFVNGTWFGLHYTEGHIPFGAFQLLPWVFYFGTHPHSRRALFGLSSLWALFLLDGGIYAFIFSLLLMAAVITLNLDDARARWLSALKNNLRWVGLCALMFLLLSSIKIIPVVIGLWHRRPELEWLNLPLRSVLQYLFFPLRTNTEEPHRLVGCYLSSLGTLLILAALRSKNFRRGQSRIAVVALFFLWAAVGWGDFFNPWAVFQKLPLINSAHIQSRLLIIVYLCFVLAFAAAFDEWRAHRSHRLVAVAVIFFIVESTAAKNYPFWWTYKNLRAQTIGQKLIQSHTLDRTIGYAEKPAHYLTRPNTGSTACYEPAFISTYAREYTAKDYRGEIYSIAGEAHARIKSYTPGRIVLDYSTPVADTVILNSNYLGRWLTLSGPYSVKARPSESRLIEVSLTPGAGQVVLEYWPVYLTPSCLLSLTGVLLWAVMLRAVWPRKALHGVL